MKCVICHGNEIILREVNEEIVVGNDLVFIPINVLVCQNCGERYYDRRTMRFLEKIETKVIQTKTELKEVGKVLLYEGTNQYI